MKFISRVIKHLNVYTSLLLHIQLYQNTTILTEDNNTSDYFIHYEEEKYLLGNK